MVSDFRRKKLQFVFNQYLDIDKNGCVNKSDIDQLVEKSATLRGWKPEDAPYKILKSAMDKVWNGIAEADNDKDGSVTAEEWINLWADYGKDPSKSPEWHSMFARTMFQFADLTNDGSINCNEYTSAYVYYGQEKAEATEAFARLSQGKSKVSWEEFFVLWKEFFSSEDPHATGNFIFGKTSF